MLFFTRDERIRYLGFDDRWAAVLGMPLLSGIAFLIFTGNDEVLTTEKVIFCLLVGVAHTTTYWILNRALVVQLRRRLPHQEQTTRRLGYTLLGSLGIVIAVELLAHLLFQRLLPEVAEAGYAESPIVFQIVIAQVLCLLVVAIYESIYFFAKYRYSLVEQERLARANMQAQLTALKQQINPHFLFNSLNTLTNLIPEDAAKATVFTQRLAAVYRRILEYRHQDLLSLDEELTALRDYVFLMQTRFEDKLRITYNRGAGPSQLSTGPASASPVGAMAVVGSVVPLTLQLLVENALKHNVVSQEHPLTIDITVTDEEIIVTNSLHLRSRPLHSTGWGQDSIRRRYRLITDRPVRIEQTAVYYRVRLPLILSEQMVHYATA